MKRCRMCGEQPLDRLWQEASDERFSGGLCFLCAQNQAMRDRYEPGNFTKTVLEVCERCGEISAAVKLTARGWLCGECHGRRSAAASLAGLGVQV